MKRKPLLVAIAAILSVSAFTATIVSCGNKPSGENNTQQNGKVTIELSETSITLTVGDYKSIVATVSTGDSVTWSSEDESIAKVSKTGKITAVRAGTTNVVATVGDVSVKCAVTVTGVEMTISKTTLTLDKGATEKLTATASDNGEITWSSSDEAVATVAADGTITAITEGTATITASRGRAASVTCTVTVEWASKPADYEEISFGEEKKDAEGNPGTWVYWNDQGWVGANVTMIENWKGNGELHFSFTGGSGCWHAFQLFYKDPSAELGKSYKVSITIISDTAGPVTFCGEEFNLVVGENKLTAVKTQNNDQYDCATFRFQAGHQSDTSSMESASLIFKDYAIESVVKTALATPTSLSFEGKKVTISPVENAESYDLYFLDAEGNTKYQRRVKDGEELDDAVMLDGTYSVKAVAVGSSLYDPSEKSDVLATYTVANGGVTYDLQNHGESGMPSDEWVYWTEFAGIEGAKYSKGVITFSCVNGGNWYSNQLFYKETGVAAGTAYSLKITSTAEVDITINGVVHHLAVGENAITGETGGTTLSIQMGTQDPANCVAEGSYTISDITFGA